MSKIQSKAKGNRGELELVKILEKRFGKGKFKRTPHSGAITGGKNREKTENLSIEAKTTLASDIITPADFAFVIEHKSREQASFWDLFNEGAEMDDWFKQVSDDASFVDKRPIVIVKYNRKKRIAYIKTDVRIFPYIFEYKKWYCYWLECLLDMTDGWWFE